MTVVQMFGNFFKISYFIETAVESCLKITFALLR